MASIWKICRLQAKVFCRFNLIPSRPGHKWIWARSPSRSTAPTGRLWYASLASGQRLRKPSCASEELTLSRIYPHCKRWVSMFRTPRPSSWSMAAKLHNNYHCSNRACHCEAERSESRSNLRSLRFIPSQFIPFPFHLRTSVESASSAFYPTTLNYYLYCFKTLAIHHTSLYIT